MNKITAITISFLLISSCADARKLFFEAPKQEEKTPVRIIQKSPEPVKRNVEVVRPPARVFEKDIIKSVGLKFIDASEIASTISGVLAQGEYCSANKTLNLLVIRGSSASIARIEKLIEELDRPPLDILFDVKVITIDLAKDRYDKYIAETAKKLGIVTKEAGAPLLISGRVENILKKLNTEGLSSERKI